jgi:hypothetical protein
MRSALALNCSVVILLPNTRISPPIPNPSPIDLDCTLAAGSAVHRSGTMPSARLEALKGGPLLLSGPQPPIQHFSDPKVSLPDRLAGPNFLQAPTSHCRAPCCQLPSWPGAVARVPLFVADHPLVLAVLALFALLALLAVLAVLVLTAHLLTSWMALNR